MDFAASLFSWGKGGLQGLSKCGMINCKKMPGYFGMGKSQRYQAAVDEPRCPRRSLERCSEKAWENGRSESEYRPGQDSLNSWGRFGE